MPLKVVIVGAGIAGLVAATSLRQAGHTVVILERSALATEVGAAVHISPNGSRVLARLGFDTVRARVCHEHHWDILKGTDLSTLQSMALEKTPGHPKPGTFTVHRVDLHRELLRLSTLEADEKQNGCGFPGWGPPVDIRLSTIVQRISDTGDSVVLQDGSVVSGDLIVAADGIHSVVRSFVAPEAHKPVHSGLAAFRFLLESNKLRADEELAPLLDKAKGITNLLADTTEVEKERHMVWYGCQNGELQNFVGIHPSTSTNIEEASDELKDAMLAEFSHFDPRVSKFISLSNHIKRWPLFTHEPLSTWVRGRVILIGDAAHPMLPFGGQGATQAMEDGAALGFLLSKDFALNKQANDFDVERALCSFEALRKNRVTRVQILSSARGGLESRVAQRLEPYLDTTAPKAPTSLIERIIHDWSYDVYAACEKLQLLN